jgi:hypothetical protein
MMLDSNNHGKVEIKMTGYINDIDSIHSSNS